MMKGGFLVGGLLIFCGAVALIYVRKRPDKIQGLTVKRFKWCCIGMILGGVVTVLAQFFE